MTQVVVHSSRLTLDLALLVLRVVAGVIMMMHGAQKMFGMFDGPGLKKMMEPGGPGGGGVVGLLVSIGEFFGGFGMLVGFLTRFSAAANVAIMIGAIVLVHGENGFFLSKKGYEYNLALIGLFMPLVMLGPGRISVAALLPLPAPVGAGRLIRWIAE